MKAFWVSDCSWAAARPTPASKANHLLAQNMIVRNKLLATRSDRTWVFPKRNLILACCWTQFFLESVSLQGSCSRSILLGSSIPPSAIHQSCWSYTKRPWATASSNYQIRPSWRRPIYTKNSRPQNEPTNCVFSNQSTRWCLLIGLTFRLKLKALHRFTSTATAVEDITALQNGKIGKGLKKFLTDEVLGKGKGKDQQQLLVVDNHLGAYTFLHLMECAHLILLRTISTLHL